MNGKQSENDTKASSYKRNKEDEVQGAHVAFNYSWLDIGGQVADIQVVVESTVLTCNSESFVDPNVQIVLWRQTEKRAWKNGNTLYTEMNINKWKPAM